MKNLLLLSAFLVFSFTSFCCYSQGNALKAAMFSIEQRQKNDKMSCLKKKIANTIIYGRLIGTSQGGYKSKAIKHISWYKVQDLFYALVSFKSNNTYKKNKEYLYGGWNLSSHDFDVLKNYFEEANSKGDFFWKYIKPYKVSCD